MIFYSSRCHHRIDMDIDEVQQDRRRRCRWRWPFRRGGSRRESAAAFHARRLVLMKISRRYEIAFICCGVLLGFNLGVWSYAAFFLPPNTDRNGLAEFLASICLVVGLFWLTVMRAEMRRKDDVNDKPDA